MSEIRTPDMWDDCHRLVRLTVDSRKAVEEQNALMRRIKAMNAEAESIRRRIEGRIHAAGLDEAVVQVGSDHVVTLGSRGFARVSRVMSAFDAAFLVAEPAAAVIAADAVTDAPSADDDMHEAASAFGVEVDMDDDISEAAFRAAVEDELGPGGADATWAITGKPATDDEYRDAMAAGLIPRSAVG